MEAELSVRQRIESYKRMIVKSELEIAKRKSEIKSYKKMIRLLKKRLHRGTER